LNQPDRWRAVQRVHGSVDPDRYVRSRHVPDHHPDSAQCHHRQPLQLPAECNRGANSLQVEGKGIAQGAQGSIGHRRDLGNGCCIQEGGSRKLHRVGGGDRQGQAEGNGDSQFDIDTHLVTPSGTRRGPVLRIAAGGGGATSGWGRSSGGAVRWMVITRRFANRSRSAPSRWANPACRQPSGWATRPAIKRLAEAGRSRNAAVRTQIGLDPFWTSHGRNCQAARVSSSSALWPQAELLVYGSTGSRQR
jgi:hypothetical protein